MELERDPQLELGFFVSLFGHALVAYLFFYGIRWGGDLGPPTIYSVTLEGGKQLGGLIQAPKKDDKSPVAPPKKVEAPAPKVEEKKPEPKKEEAKKDPPPDAEVSLKEKKEEPKPAEKKEEKKKEPPKVKPEETKAERDKRLQQAVQRYLGESTNAGGVGFGAAKLGGKGMGGGTQVSPEVMEYLKVLEREVRGGWRWYDKTSALTVVIVFNLSPSGEISNVVIEKSSGINEMDLSVERAVMKASPVTPPPASAYDTHFRLVRMIFDPRD